MKSARANASSTKFILRPYRRIPTWYNSYYLSGSVIGKGVVMNLSRTGMRVLGDHSLEPGTQLSVRILVGGQGTPLEIARASVRWVDRQEFGVQIDQLTARDAKRITRLIHEEISTRRTGHP